MKSGGYRLALFVVLLVCLSPSASPALDLYYNNIDAGLPGPNLTPPGVWAWTAGPDAVFTDEVTETGGVGGTQSYRQTTDATAAFGTSWYFQRGFGSFAVYADQSNLLAGGAAGSNNPARYRFSMDVNISGNNGGQANTPLYLGVSQGIGDYEATRNIDVNGDGDMTDGADAYNQQIAPTISVSGQWAHVSFKFDQGTSQVDSDVLPQDRGFSNARSLQWYAFYSSGAFGLDAGNVVNMDNFRIEFVPPQNGDYNDDGKVDTADYVVWRKNEGTTNSLPNDNEIGGTVGTAHYNLWRANFGLPASGGGSSLDAGAVPEPGMLWLIAAVAVGCSSFGRRSNRRRTETPH